MKSKDITALILATVIFLVAGYLAYTQVLHPSGSKNAAKEGVAVEVVGGFPASLDTVALTQLSDPVKTHNFAVPFDLTTGLGNDKVFGQ